MSDFIGRIEVPTPANSGLVFPFTSDYGWGTTRPFQTVTHRFGELATLSSQTFATGIGPRKFSFRRQTLSYSDRTRLVNFYEAVQGSFNSFTYNAPQGDKTTHPYQVIFDTQPLSIDDLVNACRTGITFVECPDVAQTPAYGISETCLRFPSESLRTALTNQVQQIIPLVHIKVRDPLVSDIYLSDRRCVVGGNTYLPRLLNMGEPGSDVIISQNINGQADQVSFTFGNADRVMTQLANDTDLKYASIDLCLYHVQSGVLLQLWKGFVQQFVSDGSAQFTMQCSDGLFAVMQQYPTRNVSRTCWKTFNDGANCPWATQGSGGDSTSCDYTFDGTNGCLSHGMQKYFGGISLQSQAAKVKDNSTGTIFGLFRDTVTSTSIVSDTIYGKALPEIWCNDQDDPGKTFFTNGLVADFRDEGDFQDGIGIVGAGPLGQFTGSEVFQNADGYRYIISPEMDGLPPHGFKVDSNLVVKGDSTTLGLREVLGTDPTDQGPGEDRLAIDGTGGIPDSVQNRAAGVSFVEIRVSTPKAPFNPTTPDTHSITVPISKGLAGYVWDAAGNRTLIIGLTNPFWIAVNCYLRAIGLFTADSQTQLDSFVLSSLVAGDFFSAAADIANLTVDSIVGGGQETQFVFMGVIGQQKPFRDWLTEILSCALGFYTFEFGKLKLGIRENASAVSAFTLGNMLYQSLRTAPIEASFEHLLIDFADRAYQYQANIADYEDKDHAAYYGRAGSPLSARLHSVGLCNLSQALRVAVTRTREEVGGINAAEWSAARNASWNTTILGLETEVGQVVSITHPDIPGGFGHFRIQSWKLLKDWSIQIQAKSVTVSMYDLEVGPADVPPDSLPILFYPQPQGEWEGFQTRANENDALFPFEFIYDLAQDSITLSDGTLSPRLIATGKLPVNTYIPKCPAPDIKAGSLVESPTDGFMPGGKTYRVAVCATDDMNRSSPPSEIIIVKTDPTSDTNSFTIHGIEWPQVKGVNLIGYTVFASDDDNLICAQQSGTLTGTDPKDITVTGPIARSLWAIPNSVITNVRLKAKLLKDVGASGELVQSIADDTLTTKLVDPDGIDDWTGRVLMVVSRNNDSSPFGTWNITAYDPAIGQFTLDRSCTVPDHPEQSIKPGDGVVVCYKGYDNSDNPFRIEDAAGTSSHQNFPSGIPHSGLVPSVDQGYILRVIAGKGRGSTAKVVDNDATGWTLDVAIPIDETSIWIVEDSTWTYSADSSPIHNANFFVQTAINMSIPAFGGTGLLVGAATVSNLGVESNFNDLPVRILYVYSPNFQATPYPWQADYAQPNDMSYLSQTDWTFGLQTALVAQGTTAAVDIIVSGSPPENALSSLAAIVAPVGFTVAAGGQIKGDQDVLLSLCAVDAGGQYSKPSDVAVVNIPFGTNNNTVGLDMTGVVWPSGAAGWDLFAGPDSDHLTHQKSGSGTPTNSDLTLTSLNIATYGLPDTRFDHFTIKVKKLVNPGAVLGNSVVAVSGNTVTMGSGGIPTTVVGDYTGCRMFLAAKGDLSPIPVWDMPIVSNVGSVFTFNEDITDTIGLGDVIGIYNFADIASANTIGCSLLGNADSTPMPTDGSGLAGNIVRIIGGTGVGQTAVIASNTGTTITIVGTWAVVPDSTSYFFIEEPSWDFTADTTPLSELTPFDSRDMSVAVTNLQWNALLVMVQTVNANGDASPESESPNRVMWLSRLDTSALIGDPQFAGALEAEFIFGQSTSGGWADIEVGNITNSPKAHVGGTFIGWVMNAGVAPVGADIQIDVLHIPAGSNTATSIFTGATTPYAVLPDGASEAIGTTFAGIQTISAGDKLRAVVNQVGSTTAGQSVTLQVYWT